MSQSLLLELDIILRCQTDPRVAERDYPQLIRRYERRILAQLYALTGNLGIAEELAHETFVTGYLSIGKLVEPRVFGAWMSGIARNVYRAWVRDRKRRGRGLTAPAGGDPGTSSDGLDPLDPARAADPNSQPTEVDRRVRQAALYAEIYRILDGLVEPYREVLLARYFEQLSCQEIAERTGRPLSTVTKQISRGHAMLADSLTRLRGFTTTLALWLPGHRRDGDDGDEDNDDDVGGFERIDRP